MVSRYSPEQQSAARYLPQPNHRFQRQPLARLARLPRRNLRRLCPPLRWRVLVNRRARLGLSRQRLGTGRHSRQQGTCLRRLGHLRPRQLRRHDAVLRGRRMVQRDPRRRYADVRGSPEPSLRQGRPPLGRLERKRRPMGKRHRLRHSKAGDAPLRIAIRRCLGLQRQRMGRSRKPLQPRFSAGPAKVQRLPDPPNRRRRPHLGVLQEPRSPLSPSAQRRKLVALGRLGNLGLELQRRSLDKPVAPAVQPKPHGRPRRVRRRRRRQPLRGLGHRRP